MRHKHMPLAPSPLPSPALSSIPLPPGSVHPMTTRSRSHYLSPKPIPMTRLTTKQPLTPTSLSEPTSFTMANTQLKRREAMSHELNALIKNGTWVLVPPFPNHHVIRYKWVFKIKRNADESIERYKA
jgi:hypothetical protein